MSKRPSRRPDQRRRAPAEPAPDDVNMAFSPTFADLPPDGAVLDRFREAAGDSAGLVLGRVARLDRGYPYVLVADGAYRAEHAVSLVKSDAARCAVGDWVVLRMPDGHDKAMVEQVLERRGELSRWDGGGSGSRQLLAANVDRLVVVQPLSKREVSRDRILRSLVLAGQGGMGGAVVLTKADRVPDGGFLAEQVDRVRRAVGPRVPVLPVSSERGDGLEEARSLFEPGTCSVLLGESGAGKSTLINALLGSDALGVGAVRDRDDQGRHTTVARRMLKVPNAGVVVDAPGLRSIPLLDEERGLAGVFEEIDGLIASCRFRDCTHGDEPGCAVREAVGRGVVDPWRLEEYRALAAEMDANRRRLSLWAPSSITR